MKDLVSSYRARVRRYFRIQWAKSWTVRTKFYDLFYDQVEIDELLAAKNKFFVLGSGRSGTQMLSGLLNLNQSVLVLHEPAFFEDRVTRNAVRKKELDIYEYLFKFRKYLIYDRLRKNDAVSIDTYGEVTGTLRYHVAGLSEVFPDAKMLILARDGRDVVRSIMQHDFYTKTSVKDGDTAPLPRSKYFDNWNEMSRFEKVCWLWADSYESLLEFIPASKIIYFEKIIKDFNYCNEHVFPNINIKITSKDWEKYLSKKSVNAISEHHFPHWKHWDQEKRDDFDRICGSIMNRLGYEYKW